MKPFQFLTNNIAKCFLQYDNERLAAKIEYYSMMAQACEERLIANRVRLENIEAQT